MLKIRRSRDRLIFNMGLPIVLRRHLYIETAPCLCCRTAPTYIQDAESVITVPADALASNSDIFLPFSMDYYNSVWHLLTAWRNIHHGWLALSRSLAPLHVSGYSLAGSKMTLFICVHNLIRHLSWLHHFLITQCYIAGSTDMNSWCLITDLTMSGDVGGHRRYSGTTVLWRMTASEPQGMWGFLNPRRTATSHDITSVIGFSKSTEYNDAFKGLEGPATLGLYTWLMDCIAVGSRYKVKTTLKFRVSLPLQGWYCNVLPPAPCSKEMPAHSLIMHPS